MGPKFTFAILIIILLDGFNGLNGGWNMGGKEASGLLLNKPCNSKRNAVAGNSSSCGKPGWRHAVTPTHRVHRPRWPPPRPHWGCSPTHIQQGLLRLVLPTLTGLP